MLPKAMPKGMSLQATTSSGISHFRKTHLKQREVVMMVLKEQLFSALYQIGTPGLETFTFARCNVDTIKQAGCINLFDFINFLFVMVLVWQEISFCYFVLEITYFQKPPCRVQRKSVFQLVIRASLSFSPPVILTSYKKVLITQIDYICSSNFNSHQKLSLAC